MIAKPLSKYESEIEVELIDCYVKRIINDGEYMKKTKYGVCVFYQSKKAKKENDCFAYEIAGKTYETVWTNKYDECVRLFDKRELTLFDFIF